MATTVEGPFCLPAPLPPPPLQHMRSSSSDGKTYSSSQPAHRRSGFPTSPPSLELGETGKTAAPSYFYLPPGIGFRPTAAGLEGAAAGEGERATTGTGPTTARFEFDGGMGVARRTSFGSNTTTDTSSSFSSAATGTQRSSSFSTATSSCASSTSELKCSSALGAGAGAGSTIRRPSPHQPAPGEDPQLAAARRALWEDPLPSTSSSTDARRPTLTSVDSNAVVDSSPDEEDDYYSSSADEDDISHRSLPSHTTLAPLPSILRPSPPSTTRSHSSSSSPASSTISVRISSDPPRSFTTFSPTAYERKGAAPVEKLSIREWIELQGVREAVGVWSGRIGKWEGEGGEPSVEGGGKVKDPMSESVGSLASLELGAGAETEKEKETKTCGHLAGVMGVRTVGHNVSPIEQSSSLFD